MSPAETLRSDPDYSEGFYDAQDGDPLFTDASEAYAAGWHAFYRCKELFLAAGFTENDDGSYSKRTVIRHG